MEIPTPINGTHITWIDLLAIITLTLPGAIAAASSLRNGQMLKKNGTTVPRARRKPRKKKIVKGEPGEEGADWFSPPDLGSTK